MSNTTKMMILVVMALLSSPFQSMAYVVTQPTMKLGFPRVVKSFLTSKSSTASSTFITGSDEAAKKKTPTSIYASKHSSSNIERSTSSQPLAADIDVNSFKYDDYKSEMLDLVYERSMQRLMDNDDQ